MNTGWITALAAILGSLVGALSSAVSTLIIQKHADRRDLLAKTMVWREALYSDFIAESARLLVDALEHNVGDTQKLIPVYALLSRIRLSSSSRVLGMAEDVIKTILHAYEQPNLTPQQIQIRAVNGEDPLRQDAASVAELSSIRSNGSFDGRGVVGRRLLHLFETPANDLSFASGSTLVSPSNQLHFNCL